MMYDNRFRNYFRKDDPCKTVEPDRLPITESMLRAFSGVLAKSFSIIFKKLWKSMEAPDN